jgi:cyclopropane-fatty-acyl-phospholipid synthase
MWDRILDRMLRDFIMRGALAVTYPDGTRRRYGAGDATPIAVTLTDPALPRRLVLTTELAVGEAYMDGTLTIADDNVEGFLAVVTENAGIGDAVWWRAISAWVFKARRRLDQWNPAARARANVAHHYDLSSELYDLFLDADRHYSCGYFPDPDMSLEAAQRAKVDHIAAKLRLSPGMEVFEIGCGWGGLALTLARDYGVRVFGVTLSEEQHRIATDRVRDAGLSDRVHIALKDYRHVSGQFDRVVSVGMFEHVGVPHYGEYFRNVHARLKDDGVALIHTIGRSDPPGYTSPWIQKYIFPGGYVPALSEMARAVETSGLYGCDVEVWRLHYAHTLRHWHDRFTANITRARALYDDRFCRMWRYYLKACEVSFLHNRQCVFQYQMTKRVGTLPISRDYMLRPAHSSAPPLPQAAE